MRAQLLSVIDVIEKLADYHARIEENRGGLPAYIGSEIRTISKGLSDVKRQLLTTPSHFDSPAFSLALKNAIGEKPLREIAVDACVSSATLSRLQRGNLPDIETFATVCFWMGADPSQFFTNKT
ncbi:hypothetical protein [Spirosoma daeguense]